METYSNTTEKDRYTYKANVNFTIGKVRSTYLHLIYGRLVTYCAYWYYATWWRCKFHPEQSTYPKKFVCWPRPSGKLIRLSERRIACWL